MLITSNKIQFTTSNLKKHKNNTMSRYIKKKREEIGLSPYAIVFRGQKKTEDTRIRVMDFNLENVNEISPMTIESLTTFLKSKTISWINIDGLHEIEQMQQIAFALKIPDNILSDIMNPSLRPKVQEFDDGLFITMKILRFDESTSQLSSENLSVILYNNTLISFLEQETKIFDPVRERIRKHKTKIRLSGPDYLCFALLDVVIDDYIYIAGQLGENIETLEETLTNNPKKTMVDQINNFKHELNFLRRTIKPAREMILALAKTDSDFIRDENRIHYRELVDNINEASDLSDSYREIVYDQLNIYHTLISSRLNDIMRTLTIYSVIFIPLTFIVGVYGTNFEYIPELKWPFGYFAMWGFMLLLTLLMLWFFRRKKWL